MPERVPAIRVRRGIAEGLDLPDLWQRGSAAAWDAWRQEGPLFVAFDETRVPLEPVQRLARGGELWVDAALTDPDDVWDLAFSGAVTAAVKPASRHLAMRESSARASTTLSHGVVSGRSSGPLICGARAPGTPPRSRSPSADSSSFFCASVVMASISPG